MLLSAIGLSALVSMALGMNFVASGLAFTATAVLGAIAVGVFGAAR